MSPSARSGTKWGFSRRYFPIWGRALAILHAELQISARPSNAVSESKSRRRNRFLVLYDHAEPIFSWVNGYMGKRCTSDSLFRSTSFQA